MQVDREVIDHFIGHLFTEQLDDGLEMGLGSIGVLHLGEHGPSCVPELNPLFHVGVGVLFPVIQVCAETDENTREKDT